MGPISVLIVEDEASLAKIMAFDLLSEGYQVDIALDGNQGFSMATTKEYDVLIIDWMIPHINGIELVKKLRTLNHQEFMIMATARDDEMSEIEGLTRGADVYLKKPFSSRQLIAHIHAFLRRYPGKLNGDDVIVEGDVTIDLNQHRVNVQMKEIDLTKIEFNLLVYLLKSPGHVFSRDTLLNDLWGFDYDGTTRIVDVHVSNLKNKIISGTGDIRSIRGIGYMWERKQ